MIRVGGAELTGLRTLPLSELAHRPARMDVLVIVSSGCGHSAVTVAHTVAVSFSELVEDRTGRSNGCSGGGGERRARLESKQAGTGLQGGAVSYSALSSHVRYPLCSDRTAADSSASPPTSAFSRISLPWLLLFAAPFPRSPSSALFFMSVNSSSSHSVDKSDTRYQSIAALPKPPPAKPFVVSTVTDVQSLLDAGTNGSSFARQGSYGSNIDGQPKKMVRKRSDLSPSTAALDLSPSHLTEIGCCGHVLLLIPRMHFRRLVELAVPSVIGSMLSVVINLVNLAFIGHLSPELLGGAALGNAFMLITGYCVLLGLCSSIDTLCAQAYGANQSKLVGLIAQRAAIAFTLVILPILAMWSRTEAFFVSAGQDPELSRLAGEYVFYCLPTIFPILYSEIIKRYLQAQSIYAPQIYIACIANLVHACAAWLMMYKLSMGLAGASIGLCIGLSTNMVCWLLYLRFVNTRVYRRTCPRINCREIFAGWGPLFRLGIPGCLMMLFEWAAFELCALGAGWLGAVQLDTIIVFSNLCTFLTMAPSGIAVSTSTLVAHAVGGGKSDHARLYAHAAGCLILVFAITESIVLGILHNYLVHVFTEDAAVAASFRNISFCVAVSAQRGNERTARAPSLPSVFSSLFLCVLLSPSLRFALRSS